MTKNWKIIIIVVIAVLIVVGVFVYFRSRIKPPETPAPISQEPQPAVEEAVPSPATANIDDVENAMLQDASEENTQFSQETNDSELVTLDNEEISDFGQSYGENEF